MIDLIHHDAFNGRINSVLCALIDARYVLLDILFFKKFPIGNRSIGICSIGIHSEDDVLRRLSSSILFPQPS